MKKLEVYARAVARREEIAERVLDRGEVCAQVARDMGLTRSHVSAIAQRMLRKRAHVTAYLRHRYYSGRPS